jgi:hypothetical protein
VCSLRRVPRSTLVLTATVDGKVQVWHAETWEPVFNLKVEADVRDVQFLQEDTVAVWGDTRVRMFSLKIAFRDFYKANSVVREATTIRGCESVMVSFEVSGPSCSAITRLAVQANANVALSS